MSEGLGKRMQSSDASLRKVAKGGFVAGFGSVASGLFQFAGSIVVIRVLSQAEYGVIALCMCLMNLLVFLALFGFGTALPRIVASANQADALRTTGPPAVLLTSALSCLIMVLLVLNNRLIADFFNKGDMRGLLQILALLVVPQALIENLCALYRGQKRAFPKVFFNDIGLSFLRLVFFTGVLLAGGGAKGIAWAYVGAAWAMLTALVLYSRRELFVGGLHFKFDTAKRLLGFSAPLMAYGVLNVLMMWSVTLFLGLLDSSEAVGAYNAPLRVTAMLTFPLQALIFLYLPVATSLHEKGRAEEFRALYVSTTKWGFLIILPFVMFILLDAEFLVTSLFGAKYSGSANVLRILAAGSAINAFLGPNGFTLVALGDSKKVFYASAAAACTTVPLSLFLIPLLSALGAALAAVLSSATLNVGCSFYLGRRGVHPFCGEYLKPVIVSSVGSSLVYAAIVGQGASAPVHVATLGILGVLPLAATIVTRSLTKIDLGLLEAIEKRLLGRDRLTCFVSRIVGE